MTDHYFSDTPASPERRTSTEATIRGRDYLVQVASGTFSPGGVDRGTQVLLDHAPPPPTTGVVVDLGCGWGPITLALANESPDAGVFAVDVNPRARQLTAENAATAGFSHVSVIAPDEFPNDLLIDCLWSNPPIRIGKKALHELLTTWLGRLSPEGSAWLVVAKHLGAESLTKWLGTHGDGGFVATRVARHKGFHVIKVTRR
jgi:16S rRNA G1207 methylase RsmC